MKQKAIKKHTVKNAQSRPSKRKESNFLENKIPKHVKTLREQKAAILLCSCWITSYPS